MKRVFLLISLVTCLGAPRGADAQHFEYVGDITFSGDMLIDSFDELKVNDDGKMVLVDRLSQAVHIFAPDGGHIAELGISRCDPGRHFTPDAVAMNNDYVFIVNGGPWGYVFTTDGTCLGKADRDYYPLKLQVLTSGNSLYGIRSVGGQAFQITIGDHTGKPSRSYEIPMGEFPNANRRIHGGGLALFGTDIFFAPSVDPLIYKVDTAGKVSTLDVDTELDNRKPPSDIPAQFSDELMRKARDIVINNTVNTGLFPLPGGLLLAQYVTRNRARERLYIDAATGTIRHVETADFEFIAVHNGVGYRRAWPDADEDVEWANPYVMTYRFVATSSDSK